MGVAMLANGGKASGGAPGRGFGKGNGKASGRSRLYQQLNDIQDVLSLAYESFCSRSTSSVQHAELIAFLDDENLPRIVGRISQEIEDLDKIGDRGPSTSNPFSKALPAVQLITGLTLPQRAHLLYDYLTLLLAARLRKGRRLQRSVELAALTDDSAESLRSLCHGIVKTVVAETDFSGSNMSGLSAGDLIKSVSIHLPAIKEAVAKGPATEARMLYQKAKKQQGLDAMLKRTNEEYVLRAEAMVTRLGVLSQAFLGSKAATDQALHLCGVYLRALRIINAKIQSGGFINFWDLIAGCSFGEARKRVHSYPLKRIQIGEVKDRGGVPEGAHRIVAATPGPPPQQSSPSVSPTSTSHQLPLSQNPSSTEPSTASSAGGGASSGGRTRRWNSGGGGGVGGGRGGSGGGPYSPKSSLDNPLIDNKATATFKGSVSEEADGCRETEEEREARARTQARERGEVRQLGERQHSRAKRGAWGARRSPS